MSQPPAPPPATNRLAQELSPYLLQHATNPVAWQPWGDEAFRLAARLDRPVFLSIGYATCHWCHVMAHESFEDGEVARLMNDAFVSVKLDREERPDVDRVYMTACQLLTGSGGWPLTVVMTPDKRPFFVATYIPRTSRFGRLGMLELVPQIAAAWRDRRGEVEASAAEIVGHLERATRPAAPAAVVPDLAAAAATELARRFDAVHGGFGGAPKFPTPHHLLFLTHYAARTGSRRELEMVEATLRAMRAGGVYDQLGWGLHRYSTDREWLVPHFEKMLYDQAMLVLAAVAAHAATGAPDHAATAREVIAYVQRDLGSPDGAFHSAEDADSEGVEGKFYLWTAAELAAALSASELELARAAWGVRDGGNFADEASGAATGANILHRAAPLAAVAADHGLSTTALEARLETIRARLLTLRSERVRPLLDDKILTDWNGLMIAALARAGRVLADPAAVAAAARAARFLLDRMRDGDGRLLHRARLGQAGIPAFLDDYAALTWGLVELYDATLELDWLEAALALQAEADRRFWDDADGGYFATASDGESLLVRPKESYDGASPSGNSIALHNLVRLSRLTGARELRDRAERLARAFAHELEQAPAAHTHLVDAVHALLAGGVEAVVVGADDDPRTVALVAALRGAGHPDLALLLVAPGPRGDRGRALAPFAAAFTALDGAPTAYVCRNLACQLPTTDPAAAAVLVTTAVPR